MKLYLKLALSGIIVLGTLSTVIAAEDYSTHRLTGPSELQPPIPENNKNTRFSRLLQDNAGVLQFSSISNLAPRLSGLKKDTKESKPDKKRGSLKISERNLGRRTLDYDSSESFDSNGEPYPRIITEPQAGDEYVYIRQGGVQAGEQQLYGAGDSVAAINRKPTKSAIPLTLLRQTNGKRINITPVFSQEQQDSGYSTHTPFIIDSLTSGHTHEDAKDGETTGRTIQGDEEAEATTLSSFSQRFMEDEQKETSNGEDKMVVNVVTSVPRFEIDGVPSVSNYSAQASPPLTETIHPTVAHDLKENLVVQSSRRVGSFPDFEDSPTRLLTSESSQPARVNVRPASSGKEYEYEYIYYYYDDEDEDNSTSKGNRSVNGSTKGSASGGTAPQPILGSSPSKASLLDNDFDDEEEIEDIEDEPPVSKQNIAPSAKDAPKSSVATPTKISNDKFASNGPINQLIRTREPKQVAQVEKASAPNVDYKIESGNFDQYEEGEEVQIKAKGQPQRPPAFEDEEDDEVEVEQPQDITAAKVSTSAPISSTTGSYHGMSTMTKTHPDSVNSPIILKQSSILQSVPASQLNQEYEYSEEVHATSPLTTTSTTTTTTTTTTTEAPQVAVTTPRSSFSRNRGQQRVRGNTPSSTTAPTGTESSQPKVPTKSRDSFRRTPARKVEPSSSTPTETSASEQSVQNVPTPTRPVPSRTRFAPRTSSVPPQILETSPEVHLTTDHPLTISPSVSTPSQDDYAKESYVKNKAANDLFTFTRLQQAISSRSPSPARKELFANRPLKIGQNSNEFGNTESAVSSEATTVVGILEASHSSEVPLPSTTTTTTTTTAATTTSEATSKFGGQRTRFSRPRKPTEQTAPSVATIQEETPSVTPRIPSRNRFSGRRTTSTQAPSDSESVTPSTTLPSSEPGRTRGPTRNRFASRTRPTTEQSNSATPVEEVKESNTPETVKTTPQISRRKPIFQGRRRNPIVAGQTANATKEQDPTEATSHSPVVESIKTTVTASAAEDEQIPKEEEKKRPGPVIGGLKRRPGVGPRLRGGRLGAPTTTTAEPILVVEKHEDSPSESDQIPTSQSEQLETAAAPNSAPIKEEPTGQRGNSGVVGRLRTRTRPLATTTTVAPEPAPKVQKASRLNGILNRRKVGGPLGVTTPSKEDSKPEAAPEEEANNNAKEQQDLLNKGVVVEVSSSITESEEVKAEHGEEQVDVSSTTAASILNRLKSQRKPGSIFRKRTDPHGE